MPSAPAITEARARITASLNLLRAKGIRINTVTGHDVAAGEIRYSIRLPDGVELDQTWMMSTPIGSVRPDTCSPGHRLTISVYRPAFYEDDTRTDRTRRVSRNLTYAAGLVEAVTRRILAAL